LDSSPEAKKEHIPRYIKQLSSKNIRKRTNAAIDLEQLGQDAEPAVPALINALETDKEPEVRGCAASALAAIGPVNDDVIIALLAALDDDGITGALDRDHNIIPNLTVRVQAIKALALMGPDPRVIDSLFQILNDEDEDPWARADAIKSIGHIGPPAAAHNSELIPVLLRILDDPSWDPWVAIWALGQMGPSAKEALPALRPFLDNNEKPDLLFTAKEAISKIEGGA